MAMWNAQLFFEIDLFFNSNGTYCSKCYMQLKISFTLKVQNLQKLSESVSYPLFQQIQTHFLQKAPYIPPCLWTGTGPFLEKT